MGGEPAAGVTVTALPLVHFLEEQRRHRRTRAISAALVVVVLAVSGIPLSVLISPILVAAGFVSVLWRTRRKLANAAAIQLTRYPAAGGKAREPSARDRGRDGCGDCVLASVLPESVSIVASDLNQAMLDQAIAMGTTRPIEWRQADAMQLPFEDGAFDAVVCQFGVMFFPDKAKAFAETRRVLRPGGLFMFSAWDRIEENEFADTVTAALASLFPADPPRFLARTPHGYHDRPTIERDLAAGGFTAAPRITTVPERSRAAFPEIPAIAFCQGTPVRNEIDARGRADRRGNRSGVGRHRSTVREGGGGREDPGARRRHRKVTTRDRCPGTLSE